MIFSEEDTEDKLQAITEIDLISDTKDGESVSVNKKEKSSKRDKVKSDTVSQEKSDDIFLRFALKREIYYQVSTILFLNDISLSNFLKECIENRLKEYMKNPEFKMVYEMKMRNKTV